MTKLYLLNFQNMETQKISPQAEKQKEVLALDKKVQKLLSQAFIRFKLGDKDLGKFFMEKAVDKADEKGQTIPMKVIESIMDGKAPQKVYAEKKEKEEVKSLQDNASKTSTQRLNFVSTLDICYNIG
jgi:hypothetical protein